MALLDMQQLKGWWFSREARERWIMGAGMVIAFFVLGYVVIWSPLSDAAIQAQKKVYAKINLINWLQDADSRIKALYAAGVTIQSSTTQNMLTLVQQSLSQQEVSQYIKQVQQPDANKVSVQFSNIPFDKLMLWLQPFIKQYSAAVDQFQANKTDQIGVVNAEIILQK